MTAEVSEITQWIPVIGTLLGTGIGFAASFVNSRYSKSKDETLSRENRDRERVEKIYRLLVTVNSDRINEMSEAIKSIHNATSIKEKNFQDFPPLLELEMLIKLYFSTLDPDRLVLMKHITNFGVKYLEFRFKDYQNESLEKRQIDSGILFSLNSKIDSQVKLMQASLVRHVKA